MKPTISNAFNEDSADYKIGQQSSSSSSENSSDAWDLRKPGKPGSTHGKRSDQRKNPAPSLSPMQADLREANFGWSLELTPMTAVDVLEALNPNALDQSALQYLVSMDQSSWREGDNDMPVSEIAERLAIPVVEQINNDQLVLNESSLRQLVSLCQPTRLLVAIVEGAIDARDAAAIQKAIDAGQSPLLAELRAVAALEVLGDRSIVLHCRDRSQAFGLVAQNFRHYLAAVSGRVQKFEAPDVWQIERLMSLTGMLTIRPIETQVFSTSIDVGINTAKQRFSQPADRSLIYDVPSNTWHDEP